MWTSRRASFRSVLWAAPTRFIVAGTINTAITLALYLILLVVVNHSVAYSIAFVCGIGLSYALNRFFVFRMGGGVGAIVLFPLVYLAQYAIGLVVVLIWVDQLDLPAGLASIAAVIVTLPITYALSRWVFHRRDGWSDGSTRTDAALSHPAARDDSRRQGGDTP